MLFNSNDFAWFCLIVWPLYWLLRRSPARQNALLLLASYIFYGAWDWRFCSLLAVSTLVDYAIGLKLEATARPGRRKILLGLSLAVNLGILGFFKYFNFFADSFAALAAGLGWHVSPWTLSVVLPVGISFYTFQTLSYTIDIYRGEMRPIRALVPFALYVSFFPQLVAGPIERASRLLPQIVRPRVFSWPQARAGLHLVLWGLFKKMVVADNLATLADRAFAPGAALAGADLWIGAIAFAFQIYADFSGYSDIARGLAKTLGFELMINFKLPYLATNPAEFWRRWHISLSTWLRDYLYIPLGGGRGGALATLRNLALTMLLGGLWHGAAWHFVAWGAYHGALLVIHRAWKSTRAAASPAWRSAAPLHWLAMSLATLVGWVLFRCVDLPHAANYLAGLSWTASTQTPDWALYVALLVLPIAVAHVVQRRSGNLLAVLEWRWWILGLWEGMLLTGIVLFGVRESSEFIYFQF